MTNDPYVVQRISRALYINLNPGNAIPIIRFGEDKSDTEAMFCFEAASAAWKDWVEKFGDES